MLAINSRNDQHLQFSNVFKVHWRRVQKPETMAKIQEMPPISTRATCHNALAMITGARDGGQEMETRNESSHTKKHMLYCWARARRLGRPRSRGNIYLPSPSPPSTPPHSRQLTRLHAPVGSLRAQHCRRREVWRREGGWRARQRLRASVVEHVTLAGFHGRHHVVEGGVSRASDADVAHAIFTRHAAAPVVGEREVVGVIRDGGT